MRQFVFAPVVIALAAFAASSQAAVTLKLDGYTVNGVTGSGAADSASNAALSRTMEWKVDAIDASKFTWDIAGQFGGSVNDGTGGKPFSAFCTELSQGFDPFPTGNLTYNTVSGQSYFSAAVYQRVGRLYSEGIVLDSAEKTAAFQIALWETIYETSGTLSVGDGNFAGTADFATRPGGTASASTFTLAQSYLNAIATTTFDPSRVAIVVYTNALTQDLIVAIPEPSTYALMFAGLAGIGALAGMRRARNAS